ncbi:hypothetical protein BGX34_003848 [Mortierella sp. NVP85]|nr:hypothetical protein BGX34_003848 [Mortierella sp. NVP85]
MSWSPKSSGLDGYWKLQSAIARLKGGNPHPGKKIHAWAREAGFDRSRITCSASVWCFSSLEEREIWSKSMSAVLSGFGSKAVEANPASQEDLKEQAKAWKHWAQDDDGWYSAVHGEILCRKE